MTTDAESRHWTLEIDADRIAWLGLDKADSNTNVLSADVLEELRALVDRLSTEPPQGLVIFSKKANGFIAGADVKEFTSLKEPSEAAALIRRGQSVFDVLEALPFPTVALIHGFCLGGGTELALACRYRVADDDARTRLGLPEVRLGIHPGFGGTVRLPPLVGAPAAMDMMLSGRTLSASAAKRIGLVDYAVAARQLRRAASALAQGKIKPRRKRWAAITNSGLVRPLLASVFRKKLAERVKPEHYPAPYALIDLWRRYAGDRKAMMAEEAASVARLVLGPSSRNLVRTFFLQERLKGVAGKSGREFSRVHVVGGGIMGGDIAAWCALQGLQVTVQDRDPKTLARVVQRAHDLYTKRLKKPRLVQAALDRLMPDLHGLGVSRADVVIEAIFEDAAAKQQLYKELEPKLQPHALLATNTSSIPLEELAVSLSEPQRLVGLHFFNPVAKMQLVEIVKSPMTDSEVVTQTAAFARRIDRLPLPVTSTPGFLVNRILMPYLLEAVTMAAEGIPPGLIDKAAVDFGMPMGPIELSDTVGLDICLSVAKVLARDSGVTVPARLEELVSAGRLGRKSGRGFYVYKGGRPQREKISGARVSEDLTDRLMLRLLNEAVACLREGVVVDADLLDAGVIFGTGFAPFRGGPINYLRERGKAQIKERLDDFGRRYGERFNADAGLAAL